MRRRAWPRSYARERGLCAAAVSLSVCTERPEPPAARSTCARTHRVLRLANSVTRTRAPGLWMDGSALWLGARDGDAALQVSSYACDGLCLRAVPDAFPPCGCGARCYQTAAVAYAHHCRRTGCRRTGAPGFYRARASIRSRHLARARDDRRICGDCDASGGHCTARGRRDLRDCGEPPGMAGRNAAAAADEHRRPGVRYAAPG